VRKNEEHNVTDLIPGALYNLKFHVKYHLEHRPAIQSFTIAFQKVS